MTAKTIGEMMKEDLHNMDKTEKEEFENIFQDDWPYDEPFNMEEDFIWVMEEMSKHFWQERFPESPVHYSKPGKKEAYLKIPAIRGNISTKKLISMHKEAFPNFDYKGHSEDYTRARIISEMFLDVVGPKDELGYKYKGKYDGTYDADVIKLEGEDITCVVNPRIWKNGSARHCFEIDENGERIGPLLKLTPVHSRSKNKAEGYNEIYIYDYLVDEDTPLEAPKYPGAVVANNIESFVGSKRNAYIDDESFNLHHHLLCKYFKETADIVLVIAQGAKNKPPYDIIDDAGHDQIELLNSISDHASNYFEFGDGAYMDIYETYNMDQRREMEKLIYENGISLKEALERYRS